MLWTRTGMWTPLSGWFIGVIKNHKPISGKVIFWGDVSDKLWPCSSVTALIRLGILNSANLTPPSFNTPHTQCQGHASIGGKSLSKELYCFSRLRCRNIRINGIRGFTKAVSISIALPSDQMCAKLMNFCNRSSAEPELFRWVCKKQWVIWSYNFNLIWALRTGLTGYIEQRHGILKSPHFPPERHKSCQNGATGVQRNNVTLPSLSCISNPIMTGKCSLQSRPLGSPAVLREKIPIIRPPLLALTGPEEMQRKRHGGHLRSAIVTTVKFDASHKYYCTNND